MNEFFQVCFYFGLKFRKLNVTTKILLRSKGKLKLRARTVHRIMKKHNNLCVLLDKFNTFFKYHLAYELSFYVILIWFFVYITAVYSKLNLFHKVFWLFLTVAVFGNMSFIVIMIFFVSFVSSCLYFVNQKQLI